jgi:hypothetical protein
MYEAKLGHKLDLQDIEYAYKCRKMDEEIRKKTKCITRMVKRKRFIRFELKNGYYFTYFSSGRIKGPRREDVEIGLEMLHVFNIVIQDPFPKIYKI